MGIEIPDQIREFCHLIGINPNATNPAEKLGEDLWNRLLVNPDNPEVKNEAVQKVFGRTLPADYSRALTNFAAFYGFTRDTPPLMIEMKLETLCIELAHILKEVTAGTRQVESVRDVVKMVVQGKRD